MRAQHFRYQGGSERVPSGALVAKFPPPLPTSVEIRVAIQTQTSVTVAIPLAISIPVPFPLPTSVLGATMGPAFRLLPVEAPLLEEGSLTLEIPFPKAPVENPSQN